MSLESTSLRDAPPAEPGRSTPHDRMQIAYVITRSDEVGGAHIHVRDMAAWMHARGHEVCVFVGGRGFYVHELRAAGVPVQPLSRMRRSLHPLEDIGAAREIQFALRDWRPHLVSAHSAKAGILARYAAHRLGIPCVFTAHGWAFAAGVPWLQRQLYLRCEQVMARYARAIITVCDSDREYALRMGIRAGGPIRTIHNGMPDVTPALRAHPGSTGAPRLVMTARFEPQKDHTSLFAALGALRDLDWQLDLIGDGPGRVAAERHVESLGLADRVDFLGRRNDVAAILARSSIYVLTSFWEGFPRSILEAMRAGLPVVATSVGGVPEAVVDGQTGWTVRLADAGALTTHLRTLITRPDVRVQMGGAGRSLFEKEFLFEIMAGRTETLYRDVLATSLSERP